MLGVLKTVWKVITVLVTMKSTLPDKPDGKSDTIKGGALAALITIITQILPKLGVNMGSELATAIVAVAYSIAGLLMVIGGRAIVGDVAIELKKLNESNVQK
jgi:hypothetical protein